MKSKLKLTVLTAIGLLSLEQKTLLAQNSLVAPATVQPEAHLNYQPNTIQVSPLSVQPGMPPQQNTPAGRKWIDDDWIDPGITIKEINYDNLPASEIANNLREILKNKVDILIAQKTSDNGMEPGSWTAKFGLHDVQANEIFRAMNELLEAENSPLRWRLKMNNSRPMALLSSIPELESSSVPAGAIDPYSGLPVTAKANQKKPMVFFVGDLIGDEKDGGLTWEHLQNMLTDIEQRTYQQEIVTGFHKDAQLLIVKGNEEQIGFIRETLQALKTRMEIESAKHSSSQNDKPADPKAVPGSAAR